MPGGKKKTDLQKISSNCTPATLLNGKLLRRIFTCKSPFAVVAQLMAAGPINMNQLTSQALIIFVRNPVEGRVKTRLAAGVGPAKALAVYRQLLAHTCDVSLQIDCTRYVYYADFLNERDLWARPQFQKRQQQGVNLGQRMANAFKEVLARHHQAVIIGSDCYELAPVHLRQSFSLLSQNDVVIGPATDGGYYLLGLRCFEASLFEYIDWSSDQVLRQTLAKTETLRLSHALTECLPDVDTEEDLLRYPSLL
jgi:uncharacterized protein